MFNGKFGGGVKISIHAPREGSDLCVVDGGHSVVEISIHAPREGSDRSVLPTVPSRFHFYPRSPRGERHERRV